MAIGVVQFLEMIKIDTQNRNRISGDARLFQCQRKTIMESGPVQKLGQGVMFREIPDMTFRLVTFAQIAKGVNHRIFGKFVGRQIAADHFNRYRMAGTERQTGFGVMFGPIAKRRRGIRQPSFDKIDTRYCCCFALDHLQEAVIGIDDNTVLGHHQRLDRGIAKNAHPCRRIFAQLPVNHRHDKADPDDKGGNHGNGKRQTALRNDLCRDGDGWIGSNDQCAHGAEMHGDNGNGQPDFAIGLFTPRLGLSRDQQRDHTKCSPHQNGGDDNIHMPAYDTWNPHCSHPGEMHCRDTESNDKTTDQTCRNKVLFRNPWNGKADEGCNNRNQKRQDRQTGIIANRQNRVVGQHCNEMSCPDCTTGHHTGQEQPAQFLLKASDACAAIKVKCRMHPAKAQQDGNQNQPRVMLCGQAIENSIHPLAVRKSVSGMIVRYQLTRRLSNVILVITIMNLSSMRFLKCYHET